MHRSCSLTVRCKLRGNRSHGFAIPSLHTRNAESAGRRELHLLELRRVHTTIEERLEIKLFGARPYHGLTRGTTWAQRSIGDVNSARLRNYALEKTSITGTLENKVGEVDPLIILDQRSLFWTVLYIIDISTAHSPLIFWPIDTQSHPRCEIGYATSSFPIIMTFCNFSFSNLAPTITTAPRKMASATIF